MMKPENICSEKATNWSNKKPIRFILGKCSRLRIYCHLTYPLHDCQVMRMNQKLTIVRF